MDSWSWTAWGEGPTVTMSRELHSRPRLPWIAAIVLLVTVAVVGLVALTRLENSLGPIDPTDPGWKVKVVNDFGVAIRVKDSAEELDIGPGRSEIFDAPGPGQLRFVLTVTEGENRALGCLSVQLNKAKTVVMNASQVKPCGT